EKNLRVYKDGGIVVPLKPTVDIAFSNLMDKLNDPADNEFWEEYFFNDKVVYGVEKWKSAKDVYIEYRSNDKNIEIKEAAKKTMDDMMPQNYSNTEDKIKDIAKNDHVAEYVSGYALSYAFMTGYEYSYYDFVSNSKDIRAWVVSSGTGALIATSEDKVSKNKKRIDLFSQKDDAKVPDGDELLRLKCERIFVEPPSDGDIKNGQHYRNLKVQKLLKSAWEASQPFELGILEIYMEMNEDKNIFTLWVLSTGGRDTLARTRPNDWPEHARWDNDSYKNEVLYVSKASWKLRNFKWSN
ncbi:MAG: hypothetical protein IJU31_00030, partial [Synergistaceae bacterium]|nr:hypothetical protein [Synergistaceae bacterium]